MRKLPPNHYFRFFGGNFVIQGIPGAVTLLALRIFLTRTEVPIVGARVVESLHVDAFEFYCIEFSVFNCLSSAKTCCSKAI